MIEASSNHSAPEGIGCRYPGKYAPPRVDAEGSVFMQAFGFTVYVKMANRVAVSGGTQALAQILRDISRISKSSLYFGSSRYGRRCRDHQLSRNKKHAQHGFGGMVNLTGSTVLSRQGGFSGISAGTKHRCWVVIVWSDRLRKSDFDREKTTIISRHGSDLPFQWTA